MKNLFLTFPLILFTLFSFAQTSTITGVVEGVDAGKTENLAFVSVSVHAVKDVAFQKTFLDDKLVLRLAYGDILRTMRWRGISEYAGLYMDASGLWESRVARINLTWKIGNQKLKENKASQVDEFKRVK